MRRQESGKLGNTLEKWTGKKKGKADKEEAHKVPDRGQI